MAFRAFMYRPFTRSLRPARSLFRAGERFYALTVIPHDSLKKAQSVNSKSTSDEKVEDVNPIVSSVPSAKFQHVESESVSSAKAHAPKTTPAEEITKTEENQDSSSATGGGDGYEGIGSAPFSKQISEILLARIEDTDVEIKPDGVLYLPEIKYRRILNQAFGPGGWGMKPIGPRHEVDGVLFRTYQLWALGRFVAETIGEQALANRNMTRATAEEGAKSNAVMRCCKDLGIASELWDPVYIVRWKAKYATEVWVKHAKSGDRRRLWRKKDAPKFTYPYDEQ